MNLLSSNFGLACNAQQPIPFHQPAPPAQLAPLATMAGNGEKLDCEENVVGSDEELDKKMSPISRRYIFQNFSIYIPAYMWQRVAHYLRQLEITEDAIPFPEEYENAVKDAMKDYFMVEEEKKQDDDKQEDGETIWDESTDKFFLWKVKLTRDYVEEHHGKKLTKEQWGKLKHQMSQSLDSFFTDYWRDSLAEL